MEDHGLSRRQLFNLKRKTLEKRIKNYYRTTNDGNGAIEMLVALQVREELCEEDFSYMLANLVQHIFLRTRSNAALRAIIFSSRNISRRKNGVYC